MSDLAIEVKGFRKTYNGFIAADSIDFEVKRGEIFGLLGPNGSGKTTTLECLEGLRTPDSGFLRILGIDPSRAFSRLRDVIGVQLQTSGLPENITANEAMRFFSAYHKVEPRYELLDRMGLTEKQNAQYHQLSTGQQRRLALALAVAHKPQVLFLDEPTAGLDVTSRVELHDLMRELQNEGTTIVLATHDMAEAEEMSDRVAILLQGKTIMIGSPMEITATGAELTKISVRTKEATLSAPSRDFPAVSRQVVNEEYFVYYTTDIGPTVSAIIEEIESQEDILIDLRVERPSLEDRFLEITAAPQAATMGDGR